MLRSLLVVPRGAGDEGDMDRDEVSKKIERDEEKKRKKGMEAEEEKEETSRIEECAKDCEEAALGEATKASGRPVATITSTITSISIISIILATMHPSRSSSQQLPCCVLVRPTAAWQRMDDDEALLSAPQAEALHEFDALNTLLMVVILGLCTLTSYLIKRYRIYYLPESAAAMLVGLFVGLVARIIDPSKAELDFLSFQPELFFFLFLPPIIFEAGYTLRRKHFFRNFGTIVAYAVLGTLISTFIVGYLTYAIGKLGWIRIDKSNPVEPLLFGALISAVDPVATLSIMGSTELNCDPLLYSLVFGESVLNDAVAIVLFRVFYEYYDEEEALQQRQVPAVVVQFLIVSCGSVAVGVAIGLLCSFLFKNTQIHRYPTYEIGLLFLFAYGSYAFAEAIRLSGIMALFFCGIVLAHYNSYNLSETSQVGAEVIFQSLAQVSETFVFLYMGMGIFTGRFSGWSPLFIIFAIFFCLLARVFNVFPISFVSNLARSQKIPMQMQFVIWFSGLRGAIAFALSQNMPGPHKQTYETTTLGVVFFTTLVCGGLTETVLMTTGMRRDASSTSSSAASSSSLSPSSSFSIPEADSASWEHIKLLDSTMPATVSSPGSISAPHLSTSSASSSSSVQFNTSGVHHLWRTFDNQFMKPMFGGRFGEDDDRLEVVRDSGDVVELDD